MGIAFAPVVSQLAAAEQAFKPTPLRGAASFRRSAATHSRLRYNVIASFLV